MVELDINHELFDCYLLSDNQWTKEISGYQKEHIIEEILKNMEVIDRDINYDYDIDTIFSQLKKDIFGLEKDSYILLNFSDYEHKDDSFKIGENFEILYLDDNKNKDLTEKLFKQETVKYPVRYKADIPFITKKK